MHDLGLVAALPFVGMGALLVGFGLLFLKRTSSDRRLSRRLRDAITSPIASAREGSSVKIRGAVAAGPGGPIAAPVSGRDAVWYRVIVEENQPRADVGHEFVEIDRVADGAVFEVDDGSGATAQVDPSGARVWLIETSHTVEVIAGEEPPALVAAFLRYRSGKSDTVRARHRRYHEAVLVPGETVHVLGSATRAPAAPRSTGYRGSPSTILSFATDAQRGESGDLVLSVASDVELATQLRRNVGLAWAVFFAGFVLLVLGSGWIAAHVAGR